MKNINNSNIILLVLIFILGLSVIPFNHVSADQYWAGQNGNIQVDVTLDNGLTYAPNDAFSVTGAIYSPTVNTVDMRVVAAGIFRQIIPVSAVNAGSIFQTISIVGPTANAGTFQAIFKTGVEEESPCITPGTVEFQRTSTHRAQINYTGPANHPQYIINTEIYWNNTIIDTPAFTIPVNSMDSYLGGQNCNAIGGCNISASAATGIDYGVISENNNFCGPQTIGNVFSFGPHSHGATTSRGVAYVGSWHPQMTVRVKWYGTHWPSYVNTTNPAPPDEYDWIMTIPAGSGTAANPQIVMCTIFPNTNCGVPLNHANYSAVSYVSNPLVGTIIPYPYSVCRYNNAPGIGTYFSAAHAPNLLADTCQSKYPDADAIR